MERCRGTREWLCLAGRSRERESAAASSDKTNVLDFRVVDFEERYVAEKPGRVVAKIFLCNGLPRKRWFMDRSLLRNRHRRQASKDKCGDEDRESLQPANHGFAATAAGSSTVNIWSARTSCSVWTMPLGQRISTVGATAAEPKPKCARLSLADR